MKAKNEDYKKIISDAMNEAGAYALKQYEAFNRKNVQLKARHELLTKADLGSEKIIISKIKKYFPEHHILSEEAGDNLFKSDYMWIIDPIDGTTNFTMHNPLWAISVALAYKEEIVLGLVYAPFLKEFYTAQKGKGSALNGKKIKVSVFEEGKIINTCCSGRSANDVKRMVDYFTFQKFGGNGCYLLGSAALEMAYLAAGRVESLYIPGVKSWDVAAGALLVTEAGGRVSDFSGQDWTIRSGNIIASNGKIHSEIVRIAKKLEVN